MNCSHLYSKGSQVDLIFRIKSKVTCAVLIKFVIHKPKLKVSESEEELILKVKLSRDGRETGLLRASERTQWRLQQDLRGEFSRRPSVEGKPRFHYLKKLFMPWKWKKKKRSEKFRSISSVLERKMSTRMSKDQLKEMGLIPTSHSGGQDSSILQSTENPCYDEAEPDNSIATVEELDESWVTQVGVIPPPAMFSPPHQSSASLVSVMKVGAGLDLSDPNLSEKIGGFSPAEKAEKDITENKEPEKQEVIEAINPLLSRDSSRLPESAVAEARTEHQNKLVLQVPSPQLGGGDEAPRQTVASLKRKLSSQCPDISPLPPRPPVREKPAKVCCQTSQEEWRDRRERIGRSLERRLSTRPSAE